MIFAHFKVFFRIERSTLSCTRSIVDDSNKSNTSCSENKLRCIYMNARSIVNKIKELKIMIEEENVDIISITETWLNDNVTDDEVSINGYTLFRKDRRDEVKCRGGGVAMYIKNELSPTFNSDLENDNFLESIWCSIGFGSDTTILGVCYRAPDSIESNDEKLYNLLNRLKKTVKSLLWVILIFLS